MRGLVMFLLAVSAAGCDALEPPPLPPQIVNLRVFGDPGKPIADAEILYNGRKIASTDATGLGQLKLGGKDGDSFEINVRCPQGFISPPKPTQVTLRRLAEPSKSPEYVITCPPSTRTIVVAVRAENGPNLPVTYLGREVARTDESGAAHVVLKLQPGDQFDLMLNTSDKKSEGLRPQNPTASFVVGQRDDVFTFDQKFEQVEAKHPRARPSAPSRPVKISK